ncbi:hypothetical protein Tco_0199476 [Tanacetum coccineum]
MGDENPIRTLGDYSKPSYEGYRNTIELPVGNNVVPLRSDTIRLVQNGCSFHGLRSEDPNQHLKDFLKLVDSLDLDDYTRMDLDFAADKNLRESSVEEAWEAIKNFFEGQKEYIAWDAMDNPSPQSTPQVLSSFEVYTSPVTYPEEVEETIGNPDGGRTFRPRETKGLRLEYL